MKAKLAFVFPGQGSQYVGMGRDLYETYPEAHAIFDQADEILGFPLSRLCFEGPEEALTDTINAQPAILAMSIACLRAIEAGNRPQASFVAGHSLGEYTALVAAEALDFADGLRLVRERGRLMKEAGERNPGGMAAIIGLDDATVEEICREASAAVGGLGVVCANFNSPGQVVISGEKEALERAMPLANERGARRVIPLAVSISSHSALMKPAADSLADFVAQMQFRPPKIPVVANVTAAPMTEVDEMKHELIKQLISPVRWVESVRYMIGQGVTTFVEIGPGKVLAGLLKRISKEVQVVSVEDVASVQQFIDMPKAL